MTRALFVLASAALLVACGTGDDPDKVRVPCTSQLACEHGKEHNAVCEAGYCSDKLPEPTGLATFNMGLSNSVKGQQPKSFRAFVIYPIRPDGSQVKCPAGNGKLALAPLFDPTQTNLSAYPLETGITNVNDVVISALWVNGPGRVVYAELYAAPLDLTHPGDEGPAIGAGCLENAPYDVSAPLTVNLQIALPKRDP